MGLEVIAMGIMTALSMGNTAASAVSQNKQAKAAGDAASVAAAADYQAVAAAGDQVNAQAQMEALKLKRQALIERGRIVAGQGETGFIGNSPLKELLVSRTQEQEALGTLSYNQANALAQNSRDMGSVFATATSRYNEARSRRVGGWASGLMIASAGASGAAEGLTFGKGLKGIKR